MDKKGGEYDVFFRWLKEEARRMIAKRDAPCSVSGGGKRAKRDIQKKKKLDNGGY